MILFYTFLKTKKLHGYTLVLKLKEPVFRRDVRPTSVT